MGRVCSTSSRTSLWGGTGFGRMDSAREAIVKRQAAGQARPAAVTQAGSVPKGSLTEAETLGWRS